MAGFVCNIGYSLLKSKHKMSLLRHMYEVQQTAGGISAFAPVNRGGGIWGSIKGAVASIGKRALSIAAPIAKRFASSALPLLSNTAQTAAKMAVQQGLNAAAAGNLRCAAGQAFAAGRNSVNVSALGRELLNIGRQSAGYG